MPTHVHHVRIAVPETSDLPLLIGELPADVEDILCLQEKWTCLRGIERVWRLRAKLAGRVHHEWTQHGPVGFDGVHVGGRSRHPPARLGSNAEFRIATALRETVLRCPGEDMCRNRVAVRD